MDGSWEEIERDVRCTLEDQDTITPRDLGARLGLSETATASLLAILALDGKVTITAVARASRPRG